MYKRIHLNKALQMKFDKPITILLNMLGSKIMFISNDDNIIS
jgi:hypothetical protein